MASVSSRPKRFRRLPENHPWWPILGGALLFLALLGVLAFGLNLPKDLTLLVSVGIIAYASVLWLWNGQLGRAGLPRVWCVLLVLSLAGLLSTRAPNLGDFGGLSGAIFVYVMLWVFASYQREPKLTTSGYCRPVDLVGELRQTSTYHSMRAFERRLLLVESPASRRRDARVRSAVVYAGGTLRRCHPPLYALHGRIPRCVTDGSHASPSFSFAWVDSQPSNGECAADGLERRTVLPLSDRRTSFQAALPQ